MKYFSTFSGIGGFELGIQNAYEIYRNNSSSENRGGEETKEGELQEDGERLQLLSSKRVLHQDNEYNEHTDNCDNERQPHCVGYSELDKYAIETYQKNFNHKNYGDITKIDEKTLPDFDLLVGGFPCQAFSIAGKRAGFDDTRGTLFFDLARILREKQPRNFIFENVKGLLSHDKGSTFRTIITTLDELGYDIEWQVLNSKNFGVPQNRERVYVVGHLRGESRPKVFPILRATSQDIKQINRPKHSNDRIYNSEGLSPTLNTMQGGNRQPFVKIPEATKKGYAEATVGQSINLAVPNSKTRRGRVSDIASTLDTGMQQYTLTEKVWCVDDGASARFQSKVEEKSPCLKANRSNYAIGQGETAIRRLTPIECERLQGFPDNWTEGVSDTQRYKQCGNAVTTNVVEEIIRRLIK